MPRYAIIEKREGETPLQALEAYRAKHPDLAHVPLTYAGRLDPMASGAVIIVIGDECRRREKYTKLDKTYEFEVLYGVSSDTGDILGLITAAVARVPTPGEIATAIPEGTHRLPYPMFSSKTVHGTPLFHYALEGRMHEIEIPETDMTVYESTYMGAATVQATDIRTAVLDRIAGVTDGPVNNFRKDDVRASWSELPDGEFCIAKYRARVSSGTYIRTLAEEAGKRIGMPALAYTIHRTQIHL